MTAPAETHRSWRYYTIRTFATIFVFAGAIAIRILANQIPGHGIDLGIWVRGMLDFLTTIAAIWTTCTIWGYDWGRRKDTD